MSDTNNKSLSPELTAELRTSLYSLMNFWNRDDCECTFCSKWESNSSKDIIHSADCLGMKLKAEFEKMDNETT